jgi:hypothetical protein
MPMDFPDMKSLLRAAECWNFRQPNDGESEDSYRQALANHVEPNDFIESQEIRNKVGWNKFSEAQNWRMLFDNAMRNRR